jgi:aldose 1-epimerase
MKRSDLGRGPAGEKIERFILENENGLSAHITNYGGIVMQLHVPDRDGRLGNVVLGFDVLQPYLDGHPCFGAIVGRIAGRLTRGVLSIAGRTYSLALNQPPNHLHGGWVGFDKRVWTPRIEQRPEGEALSLRYRSPAGEEGYPGTVDVTVTYFLGADNALHIDYAATTDEATPLSLTNHSYFNLRGEAGSDIGPHVLEIFADEYAPVDANYSFTGERLSVEGRPNDFRTPASIGARLKNLFGSHGDNYLLRKNAHGPALVARVTDPGSGRIMETYTTERCLQFYTGVSLDGSCLAPNGQVYGKFSGFCLECQGFPDATNHPGFDSIILHPGDTYRQKTIYRFL